MSATTTARALIHGVVAAGVRDVVVSPGSRSAPLSLAAAAHPDVRIHVRIDERTAAFLALGIARGRADGRPAAVICSSGTAVANHAPAVREADAAGVPLLLLTADRPTEAIGTGANQTMQQQDVHGGALRELLVVTDEPVDDTAEIASWRTGVQAVDAARGLISGVPGPVQVNVHLHEPLLDDAPPVDDALEEEAATLRRRQVPRHPPDYQPLTQALKEALQSERGIVVVGDAAPWGVAHILRMLAAQMAWPLIAEPTSGVRGQSRAITMAHWLTATPGFIDAHRPDVVLQAGRPNLSRPISALIGEAEMIVTAEDGRGWDPGSNTTARVSPLALRDLIEEQSPAVRGGAWWGRWQQAQTSVADAVAASLGPQAGELGMVRSLAHALEDDDLLVCASSLPIRHLNETMPASAGFRVVGNRGVSGIDGFVSTAVGAALGHGGRTVALSGDLSLLHDTTGFLIGPGEPLPSLPIVVLNNDGGGIFSLLPYADEASGVDQATFRRLFGTPHGVEPVALARTFGHRHQLLDGGDGLGAALEGAWASPGITLLELRTDATAEAARYRSVLAAVREALAS